LPRAFEWYTFSLVFVELQCKTVQYNITYSDYCLLCSISYPTPLQTFLPPEIYISPLFEDFFKLFQHLAQLFLVGNLKIVVSSIFPGFTPSFSLIFISFNADFQCESTAHKIIERYGELTEL
jgi:hypothetical protein